MLILNTPSFSLSCPFAPVSCSIFAVSSFSSATLHGTPRIKVKKAKATIAPMSERRTVFISQLLSLHVFVSAGARYETCSQHLRCSRLRCARRGLPLPIARSPARDQFLPTHVSEL